MTSHFRVTALLAALCAATAVLTAPVAAAQGGLPLGDQDLAETRTVQRLTRGVTLTSIVRGTEPAAPEDIPTTTRGPWRLHILTIDPRQARGQLRATYGPTLAQVDRTTDMVRQAGAVAGVNASFFTFTANPAYPGDPVGLGLFDGKLLSEPGVQGESELEEVDFLVDRRGRAKVDRLTWSGSLLNRSTRARLTIGDLNHPPVVPPGCELQPDQTQCTLPGELVQFTPEFDVSTPAGFGVEVVLDRRGCVVKTSSGRGTALAHGQTSVQATGAASTRLLAAARRGCFTRESQVRRADGQRLALRSGLHGVNGRLQLTDNGRIVVPPGTGSFFARNPRTIAGTMRDGRIVLATIDGRQPNSVGTTTDETAAVAHALNLHDSVNLDGGGSTTMSVRGALVNSPSGGVERAVGDALVYVE